MNATRIARTVPRGSTLAAYYPLLLMITQTRLGYRDHAIRPYFVATFRFVLAAAIYPGSHHYALLRLLTAF